MTRNRMRVKIRGVVYENADEAAKAFGVSASHVCKMVAAGTEDGIGLGGNRTKNRGGKAKRPVQIGKLRWESCAELADFLGWRRQKVSYTVLHGGVRARADLLRAVMERQLAVSPPVRIPASDEG